MLLLTWLLAAFPDLPRVCDEETSPEVSSMGGLVEKDSDRSLGSRFSVVPRGVLSGSRLPPSSRQRRERDSFGGVGSRAPRDESSLERDCASLRLTRERVCVGEAGGGEAVNARWSASESLDNLRLPLHIGLDPVFPSLRFKGSMKPE